MVLTRKRSLPRYLWQRRINQLFKINLVVLHIKQRLARADRRFAKLQRARGLVAVQRFDIQCAERIRYILGRENGASAMFHELERFFEDLGDAVFDVPREIVDDIVVERGDAHGFGDVLDVVGIPHRHVGR